MCAKFNVDSPFVLAVGGQKNGFHIINLTTLEDGKIITSRGRSVKRGIVIVHVRMFVCLSLRF